jgi:hypothetical protein
MRSYSFDVKFDDSMRKSPKKLQIKINGLKLNYLFLTFIIANKFIFTFHNQKISLLIELVTFVYCLNTFYCLYKLSNENNSEEEEFNCKKSFLSKHSYSIYILAGNIIDLLIIIFFENEGFNSFNNFEIYFSYVKLFFILLIILVLIFIQFYFRSFIEKMKQEVIDNYEI